MPHSCDFFYKDAFFEGGRSFYTQTVDGALAEINRLPGRHLYFLDDHLFGNGRFARDLFAGMEGMGRLWQAAGTVKSLLQPRLLEAAVQCGLRSLFVGFETASARNLRDRDKRQNLDKDDAAVVRRLRDLGVMVNASFVYGMDDDDPSVFERAVEWAVSHGVETATFHILTPHPGTGLYQRMQSQGRILSTDWDRYDTPVLKARSRDSAASDYPNLARYVRHLMSSMSSQELNPCASLPHVAERNASRSCRRPRQRQGARAITNIERGRSGMPAGAPSPPGAAVSAAVSAVTALVITDVL